MGVYVERDEHAAYIAITYLKLDALFQIDSTLSMYILKISL